MTGRPAWLERRRRRTEPPERDPDAQPSPGASGPGEPGYEGETTVGDEAGPGHPDTFDDPFGRPEPDSPPT